MVLKRMKLNENTRLGFSINRVRERENNDLTHSNICQIILKLKLKVDAHRGYYDRKQFVHSFHFIKVLLQISFIDTKKLYLSLWISFRK